MKEMVSTGLVPPLFFNIDQYKKGDYALEMNYIGCDLSELRAFLADKELLLFVDEKTDMCKISSHKLTQKQLGWI